MASDKKNVPPIGKLAPDLNIQNFYKNLASIQDRRKKWETTRQQRAGLPIRRTPSEAVAATRRAQRLWNKLNKRRNAWRKLENPDKIRKKKLRKLNHERSEKIIKDRNRKGIIERAKKGKIIKIKRLNLHKREILPHHYRKAHIDLPWPWKMYLKLMNHRKEYKFVEDEEVIYAFTQRERSINTPMDAVLSIHILEVKASDKVAPTILNNVPCCYYSVVSIGSQSRASRIVAGRRIGKAKLDLTLHMGFTVSRTRMDPNNTLVINIWCFQDPEAQFVVGEAQCHVYELINQTHGIQKVPMWVDGIYTGWLVFEFAFAYGSLGYGFSNQLRNTRENPNDVVSNSMFPRIRLDKTESSFEDLETIMPKKMKIMDIESLLQEIVHVPAQLTNGTYLPSAEKVQPISMMMEHVHFADSLPHHCVIHDDIYQKDLKLNFNDTYGEYISLRHRKDRVAYLHELVHGNQNDIAEDELAALLFSQLTEQEEEEICDEEDETVITGAKYIYPRPGTRKCPDYNPVELSSEDESFLDKFPSLPRQQGYLSMLFGYSKPTPDVVLTKWDNPLPQKIERGRSATAAITYYLRKLLFKMWQITDVYACVKSYLRYLWTLYRMHCFPRIKYKKFVTPVIAVTTPSAPESLTKVQCYFADDPREKEITDVMKLVERATNLITSDIMGEIAPATLDDSHSTHRYTGSNKSSIVPRTLELGAEDNVSTVIEQIKNLFLGKKEDLKAVAVTVGSVMSLYNRAHDNPKIEHTHLGDDSVNPSLGNLGGQKPNK